jgi:uncharacterized protein YgiM (DUF1202 family)
LKLRKGRCSNDPRNCTLAAAKTELPYAGIDSICPECNAPLAALAGSKSSEDSARASAGPVTPPPPPIVQPTYTPAPPTPSSTQGYQNAPRLNEEPRRPSYDYEPETKAPRDNAMRITQIVVIGAAVALIGFFGWRMFLQPRPVGAPDSATSAPNADAMNGQILQISPAQMRRANVPVEVRTIPDPASAIVSNLAAGALLDVTGQVQVAGITWLRVTLPNDSSKSGFVRDDQMAPLGDVALQVVPNNPLAPNGVPGINPGVASTEVLGPIQALVPQKFYVATRTANVRQDANTNSGRVGTLSFNDELQVVAQRTLGGALWYQVELPNGGGGWMNARLLSGDQRETPVDSQPITPPVPGEKLAPKPSPDTDAPASEVGKRDNREALLAFGPGTTLRVDAVTANLRKEPGATGNSVIEALARDTLMSVEDVRVLNGVPWYRVTTPGGAQGWISGRTVVEDR